MIELQTLGAAQTVTGSMHLVRTRRATVLLDCGMYQGRRHESFERNAPAAGPRAPRCGGAVARPHRSLGRAADAVPAGLRGPIYATPATRDLCAVMLRDAAAIQATDARYLDRLRRKESSGCRPSSRSSTTTTWSSRARPHHQPAVPPAIPVAPGISVTFLDAGHVLGSAITVLDVERGRAPSLHRRPRPPRPADPARPRGPRGGPTC